MSAVAELSRADDRGAVLVHGLFLLILVLTIGVLVIDLLRIERMGRMLQRTADAAALAGAIQLDRSPGSRNGSMAGWNRAKRAVFAYLRGNEIFGDSGEVRSGPNFGTPSECDDPFTTGSSGYGCRTFTYPRLRATVERGFYFRAHGAPEGTPIFLPLEGNAVLCQAPAVPTPAGCCDDNPKFEVANATRVTLVLEDVPTVLGALIGASVTPALTRVAVGAPDPPEQSTEVCS